MNLDREMADKVADFLHKNKVSSQEFKKNPEKYIAMAMKSLNFAGKEQKVRVT